MLLLLVALAASLGLSPVAHGQAGAREPRLALVIANGNYRGFDRLSATFDDGERISAALSATGFVDGSGSGAVRTRRDLTAAQMEAEIAAFRAALAAAGPEAFGVLYFSGHGVALGSGGDVQMVPVDIGKSELSASASLSRSAVTRTLMASGARNVLVVLDMCRNVIALPTLPVATDDAVTGGAAIEVTGSKGLKRVLRSAQSPIRPDQGYLVAFSTSADQFAFDNGIFSKVLAEEIRRPQQNIADAMKRVSDRVAMAKASSFQKPTFDYGLQGQPPCFVSCDPSSGNRFYDCANCPWMRIVPAGSALVGSPPSEPGRGKDEPAQTRASIARDFAIGVYEVTVAEWTACVRDGACPKLTTWAADNPNPLIPATSISHDDALAFLGWLSRQSGRAYRLPSDAEWEYASRAGASSAFPWGDGITPSDANYDHTARYQGSPTSPYRGYPEAVSGYPPNAFGLYQMQGNVWEWTSACIDPACRNRALRGGSFESVPGELRAANRFGLAAAKRRDDVGLRVARDLESDEGGG
ncbi:SUMF1/EgtB/PvdO family nonheme iron enzyme [Blastomonas sp. SL216]|uniref:SUMF1/EgtB/PvdO family nonheme iron enzyme n=1 Tax=Blastomonas sp. SL216 TaxID=2995169 RepID=UPI002376F509|nr:SUMF1/EgtB/PvdO family nonheme iron enzyme [Blastomonas sp. SL216]